MSKLISRYRYTGRRRGAKHRAPISRWWWARW